MQQLIAGISKLNTGYTDLDNGIKSLNENSKKLEAGSKSIYDGLTQAKSGIETIDSSVGKIQEGATTLSEGTTKTKAGITQIINSVSALPGSDTTSKITELETLKDGNSNLIDNYTTMNESLKSNFGDILAKDDNNLNDNEKTLKSTITQQIALNVQNIAVLQKDNDAIDSTIATLKASSTEAAQELKNALNTLKVGIENLETGAQALETGTTELKAGTSYLNSSSDALVAGAKQVSDGISSVSSGTETLANGSTTIKEGLTTLDTSSKQILSANNQLTDAAGTIASGAESLESGTQTLTDGIHKFNIEGIQKISKYVNVDLQNLITRGQKLEELSNNYNTFGSDKERNSIKFISIIDSIKNSSQEKTNETAIVSSGEEDKD
jgi:X-X-X-Leu-X-X-Gly heptad repeat protein